MASQKYPEYKQLNLPELAKDILDFWKKEDLFEKSVSSREGKVPYVFYEGPPSANGTPGIHHAMARTIKDIFCRYKTQKGFQVKRKAGWDTHGLPVELSVEKELGITKEDIGKRISVDEYNRKCKEAVMKYTNEWNELTEKLGYWVDMDSPYITYENKYIESVWFLLKELYNKGLIYKGYTIQPFSPAAGTGLSSHELNQPGCYRDVTDTTAVAQFKAIRNADSEKLYDHENENVFFIAWTTTPWTLPSNTALCVGPKIKYVKIASFNPYTFQPISVILAEDLVHSFFTEKQKQASFEDYKPSDKLIPFKVLKHFTGNDLLNCRYEQLLPYARPENGDAFKVITGNFVTTQDGTGIVHIAPSFGSDDFMVAKNHGIGSLTLVDEQGKFKSEVSDFAGMYVKNEYYANNAPEKSVDVLIAIKLKEENKAFKVEKYVHSYPHCWRTDKPILFYPLDSWFIKTTAVKDRMIELNQSINWKPESTGTGRFGNWLENLQDWNLSRSRYWGIPIPIWSNSDGSERICIGSVSELKTEIEKSMAAGFMQENPLKNFIENNNEKDNYEFFDLHRNVVDKIILVSNTGQKLYRESDLIDVWFDSGAMPYAQLHYPFENKELIDENKYFPADFIAEGVDQTRGWFFTLHAIATMCFDSVAYKNVVSNGLVLDKNGQKMSKRLGNAVDPFKTIETYGPDATRWYMITNAQPWDNLKFDEEGIAETQRKFFRALHNTYSFYALYANVDGYNSKTEAIELSKRTELDRWIISKLHSLIVDVEEAFESYEPTRAGRLIQDFAVNDLSNWFVRLSRKRFWRGDFGFDKKAAYHTLRECLEVLAKLAAPIAPFYADRLFSDLQKGFGIEENISVHLADWPKANLQYIEKHLEAQMDLAQRASSLALGLRKKEMIKVRQPLQKILIPVMNEAFKENLEKVKVLILAEVNVKELHFMDDDNNVIKKEIKPNFKALGPKFGSKMKAVAAVIQQFGDADINKIEQFGSVEIEIQGEKVNIELSDVELKMQDIPGYLAASDGVITLSLDINISPELQEEGVARELVNRIQNLRKSSGFEVTDKILLELKTSKEIAQAVQNNLNYICSETLANSIEIVENLSFNEQHNVSLDDIGIVNIGLKKL